MGVPEIVVNILRASGFDSKAALEIITRETIADIEEYVEEHRELLRNSVYRDQIPFKLYPGHKAIILGMPKRIEQCVRLNNAIAQTPPVKRRKMQTLNSAEIEKEIELLLKKLQNYSDTLGLAVQFERSDISDFVQASDRFRCRFKCRLCTTVISCFKLNYWMASNALAHLKRHRSNYEIDTDGQHHVEKVEVDEYDGADDDDDEDNYNEDEEDCLE